MTGWLILAGDLLNALQPADSPPSRRWLFMLTAYFDESYQDKGRPRVMVVAGYLAHQKEWARFDRDWRRFRSDFRIEGPFHMVDFENYEAEYKHWSKKKHFRCVDRLVKIISELKALKMAFSVNLNSYETLLGHFQNPYGFCIWEWMQEAERYMDKWKINAPVAYVFEGGSGFGGQIEPNFHWMRRRKELRERYRLGSFGFADKRDVQALQAVDVLAYESRKQLVNVFDDPPKPRPMRKSLKMLMDASQKSGFPIRLLHHRDAELERYKKNLEAYILAADEKDFD